MAQLKDTLVSGNLRVTDDILANKINGVDVGENPKFTDTDTKVTSVDNHYTPSANANSELTASLSGTVGSFATNTEYTVLTGVKAQRDAKGHVTGLTYTAQKVKDTTVANTDRYVNSASFADDTTNNASNPVKMTLTRAGSDSATVTGNLPKVSSSSAGVVPKGAAVSSQSQSTKFLREDGTWAAPSYTTNTNTHYTAVPVAGGSSATSNATSDTSDPYLNIVENNAKSGGIQIKGTGATTVTAKNGVITINSTDTNTNTDTKVTQTVTSSSNTSFRPLLVGDSYSDAETFSPSTTTASSYATHLAKFAPSTGILALVGMKKMNTSGAMETGSNNAVFNTNGTTTTLSTVATSGSYNDLSNKPTIPEDNIFIATIGTTPFADIKAAYNAGKTIVGKVYDTICSLVDVGISTGVGLTAVTFGFVDSSNNLQQVTINSSDNITSSTQSIYNGTFTVKSKSGNTTTNVSDFTANQSAADDVTFIQGSNVTLTPNATNRTITIAATDTTYENKAAASGGTAVSLVTTGEKYTWNNKGTYSKPSGGIPASDLANGVIPTVPTISTDISADATSDAKTASPKAVKTFVEGKGYTTNTGTITGITMNGASKGTSGVVNLGTVLTSHQDISGKENTSNKVTSISSSSTDTQYPSAKAVYDKINPLKEMFVDKDVPTFGGLELASGPLAYENQRWIIKDNWNYTSYNSVCGKNNSSTFFKFSELCQLFDGDDDGDIENLLDPLDGWRLPTRAEWCTLTTGVSPGIRREGSKVNATQNARFALIQLTGVSYAGSNTPVGLLLFPDGKTITGKIFSYINSYSTLHSGVTGAELQEYLAQGCVFLPMTGRNTNNSWDNWDGEYFSSEKNVSDYLYGLYISQYTMNPNYDGMDVENYYQAHLVRTQSIMQHINKIDDKINGCPINTFGGLEISPGPLKYGEPLGYAEHWYETSYGGSIGFGSDSTFFSYDDLANIFVGDYATAANSNGLRDNRKALNGWRIPTTEEWLMIFGKGRPGATVNQIRNKHFAQVTVNTTYAGSSGVCGWLLFPDREEYEWTISGTSLTYYDDFNSEHWSDISESQLNEYLYQGCVFLPSCGTCWLNGSSTTWERNDVFAADGYYNSLHHNIDIYNGLNCTEINNFSVYMQCWLVKDQNSGLNTKVHTLEQQLQNNIPFSISIGSTQYLEYYNHYNNSRSISLPAYPTVSRLTSDLQSNRTNTAYVTTPKPVYDEIHPAFATSMPSGGFKPNILYKLGTQTGTKTWSMANATVSTITNHYYWTFETSTTAPTITWPSAITSWIGGSAPTIEASKHYEISVLNGVGCCIST